MLIMTGMQLAQGDAAQTSSLQGSNWITVEFFLWKKPQKSGPDAISRKGVDSVLLLPNTRHSAGNSVPG